MLPLTLVATTEETRVFFMLSLSGVASVRVYLPCSIKKIIHYNVKYYGCHGNDLGHTPRETGGNVDNRAVNTFPVRSHDEELAKHDINPNHLSACAAQGRKGRFRERDRENDEADEEHNERGVLCCETSRELV